MTEEAGVNYYFSLVKHIYSGNVFPIAYLDHIKDAKPKSALLSINVIGATGFDTHSVKFVFSFFL